MAASSIASKSALAPPPVIGVAQAYDASRRVLSLKCINPLRRAVSHGLKQNALVVIGSSGFVQGADDEAVVASVPKGAVTHGVVRRGTEQDAVTFLDVEVSPLDWIVRAAAESQCMSVSMSTEPCSFCFVDRLRDTVGGMRLGFPSTTVQWGLDGAVRTRKLRIPPFISPGQHNLDHVDFILLRLRESNKSTHIQYETNGTSVSVWGKVCLNPTFRNERHLPVELNLSGSDRLETFTVEVLNPDLTPYRFGDAQWSLSVSFVS